MEEVIQDEIKYPVAEIFFSTQGEGGESGMATTFIRLAGCTVGKRYKPYRYDSTLVNNPFPIFVNECTIYDGRKFPCDTDYRKNEFLTAEEILARVVELNPLCKTISITGGEPLMHDIFQLVTTFAVKGYWQHLETSGTIELTDHIADIISFFDYVVISPKFPFLDSYVEACDEIRLLVDQEFNWGQLPESIRNASAKVWISPVNDVSSINIYNAKKCSEIQFSHPEVRISLQMHKTLGVR